MIYFDNSATTRPKKEVLDTFYKVSQEYYGNPSSIHGLGLQAEKLLKQARTQVATLLGVKNTEIVFTSGGTEGNNFAIKGVAQKYRTRGNHIITTEIEHPSVRHVCEQLEKDGYKITYLPVSHNGFISVEELKNALTDETILVSVMHTNNEVGSIQPVEEIGLLLKNYPKVLFHVDYVQGVGKVPLDLHRSYIDLATISSHKFHGLKGTGALYIREGLKLEPLFAGGNQENTYRSGTENVAGIVAMAKALRMTMDSQKEKVSQLREIRDYLRQQLEEMEDITIHSPKENGAPHILNFSVDGFKAEVLVHAIAEKDVYVSTTSACSSKLNEPSITLMAMGVDKNLASSSIRISLSYDNSMDEAVFASQVIKNSVNKLKNTMRRSK